MALYNLWLFVWDDVFDGEDDLEARPLDLSDMYNKTIDYVEFHLGLADSMAEVPAAPTPATGLFQHAGRMLQEHVDMPQRKRFFEEIKTYVRNCAIEQTYLNRGIVPSVEEYWNHRWGTSSVYTGCALAEYMSPSTTIRKKGC